MAKNLLLHFLKGLLAGLAISLGGFLYCLMVFLVPGVGGKFLGSVLFSVGLFLVCSLNLSLYTGKIGLIYEGKQDRLYYISLPIILIANLGAAFGVGLLANLAFQNVSGLIDVVNNAAATRLSLDNFDSYFSLCVASFLCGLCVYLAVKLFALRRMKPLGIFFLVFFVFVFVYCGFQHCIANMFYFGFAKAFKIEMLFNLILCILFNSFGPIVGVLVFKAIKSTSK